MASEKEHPRSRDDEHFSRTSGLGRSCIGALLKAVLALCCLAVLLPKLRLHAQLPSHRAAFAVERMTGVCPQAAPITPGSSALLDELEAEFATDSFRSYAYESLGGAIRIPYVILCSTTGLLIKQSTRTQMYDDMGVPGEDPKWDIFAELHEYLQSRFPLVYVVAHPLHIQSGKFKLNTTQSCDTDKDDS